MMNLLYYHNMRKTFNYIASALIVATSLVGCTNLDETLYDQVASQNYYNTKSDVIRAVLRPFEHGYWSVQSRQVLNEETADQLITRLHVRTGGTMVDAGHGCIGISG